MQDWLRVNCTDFIAKDEWPPNSPDLNPLDYHVWGAMLQAFHKLHPKPKTIPELKSALQQIWDDLPQTTINKAVNDFRKRLNKMRFGRWWTFWAHDVNFVQKYFNWIVCRFIKRKKSSVLTSCLSSVSKPRGRCVVKCKNSLGGRA